MSVRPTSHVRWHEIVLNVISINFLVGEGDDRSVGLVAGLQTARFGIRIPAVAKNFFVLKNVHTGSKAPPPHLHVITSLRRSGAITLSPLICFHVMDREFNLCCLCSIVPALHTAKIHLHIFSPETVS